MEVNFEVDFDIMTEKKKEIKENLIKKIDYREIAHKYFEQLEIIPIKNEK